MQRYLDQDLEEIEYKQMLGHLETCPDCTQLFQRLLALSHELGQLPKVIPAYSLVDAILPKLEQIDQGTPVEDLFAAGAATPLAAEAGTPKPAASRVEEMAARRKRMRGLFSTRIIGGVVAAGLLLGFFIFEQQQQGSMNNADGFLFPNASSKDKAASTSKQDGAAGSKQQRESQATAGDGAAVKSAEPPASGSSAADANAPAAPAPLQEQSPAAQPVPDNSAGQSKAANPANSAGSGSAAAPADNTTGAGSTPPAAMGSAAAPAPPPQEQASQPAPPTASQPPAAESTQPPTADRQAATEAPSTMAAPEQPTGARNQSPPANGFAPGAGQDQPKALMQEPAPKAAGAEEKQRSDRPLSIGIMSISATKSSVDGAYTASINSEHSVEITDKQGKKIFTSTHKAGDTDEINLVGWAKYKLTYEISGSAGTVTYVINATDKTEVKK